MSKSGDKVVSMPVEPVEVGEIKALVEPVRCRGGDITDHLPVEAECIETGVGYVVYECDECGLGVRYYHATDTADPCCSPRS